MAPEKIPWGLCDSTDLPFCRQAERSVCVGGRSDDGGFPAEEKSPPSSPMLQWYREKQEGIWGSYWEQIARDAPGMERQYASPVAAVWLQREGK